jgi:hypothetical protein
MSRPVRASRIRAGRAAALTHLHVVTLIHLNVKPLARAAVQLS